MVERWKANSRKREADGGMDRTFKSVLEAVLSKWPLKTMGGWGGGGLLHSGLLDTHL